MDKGSLHPDTLSLLDAEIGDTLPLKNEQALFTSSTEQYANFPCIICIKCHINFERPSGKRPLD